MLQPLYNACAQVYLIDNDQKFCQALISTLSRQGLLVKKFNTVKRFISWVDYEHLPDSACILCEANLAEMSGMDLLQVLKADSVDVPTILMSHQPSIRTVVEAMSLGANYFIEKSSAQIEFVNIINHKLSQAGYVCEEEFQEIRQRFNTLSVRQKQVLLCVFRGEINKKIAEKLNISIKTVELHRALMMKKMQADSLSKLIQMAVLIDQTTSSSAT